VDWFRRKVTVGGSILYRSAYPPPLSALAGLAGPRVAVKEVPASSDARWMVNVSHPEWGEGQLMSLKDAPLPPPILIDQERALTDAERQSLKRASSALMFKMDGNRGDVLRDRKHAFRLMHAFLGEEGVGICDHLAQRFWSREALTDELSHDAALDIEAVHVLHAVSDESGAVSWLHSHGLGEIGFFDFDILRPDPQVYQTADLLRALAFHIVEGKARVGERLGVWEPGGEVLPIDAAEFDRTAAAADVKLRDDPGGDHRRNRVVLCEPKGRWSWRKTSRPSAFLSEPIGDQGVLSFSTSASALMADRARNTYDVFRETFGELAAFELPAIVKLGYPMDGDPGNQEHLWFEVHALSPDKIDATLMSAPFYVAALNQGDRGRHSVELLSDWTIFTPLGPINPRSLVARRVIRADRAAFRAAVDEARASVPHARET
jgi:hypothetical protein